MRRDTKGEQTEDEQIEEDGKQTVLREMKKMLEIH